MIFHSRWELEPFPALGSWILRLDGLNAACSNAIRLPGKSLSSWIEYSQTVGHRYILFAFMMCSFFFRLHPMLSISSAAHFSTFFYVPLKNLFVSEIFQVCFKLGKKKIVRSCLPET